MLEHQYLLKCAYDLINKEKSAPDFDWWNLTPNQPPPYSTEYVRFFPRYSLDVAFQNCLFLRRSKEDKRQEWVSFFMMVGLKIKVNTAKPSSSIHIEQAPKLAVLRRIGRCWPQLIQLRLPWNEIQVLVQCHQINICSWKVSSGFSFG